MTRVALATYDPGPHPPQAGASGPILWIVDPLGNRVELTPPAPPPPPDSDGDEPIMVNRSE